MSGIAAREAPGWALAAQADAVARACRDMAERFRAGGRLLVFGTGQAAADAQHVAVEFVHPVIVGKRALPAIALTSDVATITGAAAGGLSEIFAYQIRVIGEPADMAFGIAPAGPDPAVAGGLEEARRRGQLTIALTGPPVSDPGALDHCLVAGTDDPLVVRELHVTTYHILWELVHVFLEQPGEVVS